MKETRDNPGVRNICEDDELIRELTRTVLDKIGSQEEQGKKNKDNIRTKVRTVARIMKKLNENKVNSLKLSEYIVGPQFYNVVRAVKNISIEADSPSLSLNCGYYIRHILLLKISLGVAEGNEQKRKEGSDFNQLYEGLWNSKISCIANRRKNLRDINKERKIQTTKDILALRQYVQKEIQEIVDNSSLPYQEMKSMAELLIVRLALFNKRRISVVDELKVSDYECRPKEK